ncbi:MAG TPA: baseplate J/gp47 family protein [Candidatus Limnocylindrales bacterium]|nr:baseplate J/gp47 family protein [Candidatus Limnocylindrales bacterium]
MAPGDGTAAPPPSEPPDEDKGSVGAALAIAAAADGPTEAATPTKALKSTRKTSAPPPVSDETQKVVLPPPRAEPATAGAATAAAAGAAVGATTVATAPVRAAPSARMPVARSRTFPKLGTTALVIAGMALLGIIIAGVAAYVYLPSATIVLTPKEEPIPPISLSVRADPDATTTDAESGVVPADRIEVPVEVSDTFETTGRRIEEGKATGEVTFTSENTFIAVTVPRGTRVSTGSGVAFLTTAQVVIPKASFAEGPARRDARIEAVKAGPSGNVEAGTITQLPSDLRALLVSVTNAAETTGGTHEEFPQVSQDDVTAAVEQLNSQLAEAFTAAVADGAGAPPNTTVYPETALLGEATPSVDPATLVGREVATFDLGVGARGTVIAVDDRPVEGIARERLLANVGSNYELVGDPVITRGDPTVTNGQVSFPVTASASRVKILDRAALIALVKGMRLEEARKALSAFGQVDIRTWPDWVSSIPDIDSRVSLEVVGQDEGPASTSAP